MIKPLALPSFAQPRVKFGNNSQPQRTLTVLGQGKVEKDPDTMSINLSRSESGKSRKPVLAKLKKISEGIIAELGKLKLPIEMKSSLSTSPQYIYNKETRQQERSGYQGNFRLNITEKDSDHTLFPEHAAQIFDVAEHQKADFSGPSYSISTLGDAEYEAQGKAMENAIKSAKNYAKAGGFKISMAPLSVSEVPPSYGGGGFDGANMEAASMRSLSASNAGGGSGISEDSFQVQPLQVFAKPITAKFKIMP